jgi:Domain of unknown function (DUF4118)
MPGTCSRKVALWFDFFFTLPYYRFTIRSSADVTTAVLLLLTGLAVSQLAARARRLKIITVTDAGYLAHCRRAITAGCVLVSAVSPWRRRGARLVRLATGWV